MEKGKQKALLVKMEAEMHKLLKIKATEQGVNMTAVVLRLIQDYLAESGSVVISTEVAIEKE
jgi:predicted HicB family RNase H-like nuclease